MLDGAIRLYVGTLGIQLVDIKTGHGLKVEAIIHSGGYTPLASILDCGAELCALKEGCLVEEDD